MIILNSQYGAIHNRLTLSEKNGHYMPPGGFYENASIFIMQHHLSEHILKMYTSILYISDGKNGTLMDHRTFISTIGGVQSLWWGEGC